MIKERISDLQFLRCLRGFSLFFIRFACHDRIQGAVHETLLRGNFVCGLGKSGVVIGLRDTIDYHIKEHDNFPVFPSLLVSTPTYNHQLPVI